MEVSAWFCDIVTLGNEILIALVPSSSNEVVIFAFQLEVFTIPMLLPGGYCSALLVINSNFPPRSWKLGTSTITSNYRLNSLQQRRQDLEHNSGTESKSTMH
jgi:hypothetical protein